MTDKVLDNTKLEFSFLYPKVKVDLNEVGANKQPKMCHSIVKNDNTFLFPYEVSPLKLT